MKIRIRTVLSRPFPGLLIFEVLIVGALAALRLFDACAVRWRTMALLTMGFLVLDGLLVLFRYDVAHRAEEAYRAKRRVVLCLAGIVLLASVPLGTDYILRGHDLNFHLWRIEGVADGIRCGQFPVRIHPDTLNGYGYANSAFYPELLLYLPALLRVVSIPVQTAYKLFLLFLNALTAGASYLVFSRMFRSEKLGLAGAFLYTLSLYRLVNLYTRAALGEASAIAFLPLVLYGMYRILSAADGPDGCRSGILPLALGMFGLVSTHILSCEIAAGFLLLTGLIFIRRVLEKQRLLSILAAAGICVVLALYFLVPMLDFIRQDSYAVFTRTSYDRTVEALQPAQLFPLLPTATGESNPLADGIPNEMPLGVGFAYLPVLLLYPVLYAKKRKSCAADPAAHALSRGVFVCWVFAVMALFCTTALFPWYYAFRVGGLPAKLAQSLQFPWRFLSVSTLFLTPVFCMTLRLLPARIAGLSGRTVSALLLFLALLTPVLYMDRALQELEPVRATRKVEIPVFRQIGDGEYLPAGAAYEAGTRDALLPSDPAVAVSSCVSDGTSCTFSVKNGLSGEAFVDLPRTYYTGYQATDETGAVLSLEKGANALLRLRLPAGYSGTVTVCRYEKPLWRVADILSLLGAAGIAAYAVRARKKRAHSAA